MTALRESQNLNYTQVSERLFDVGRKISAVGVRRIESGERRVDVDDLIALALALRTSPASLLMPGLGHVGPGDRVQIAEVASTVEANDVWSWLTAQRAIDPSVDYLEFGSRSWPKWVLSDVERMVGRTREERARIREGVEEDLNRHGWS
ncbi:helix-turn-helix transcriptional regulator [Mycolicibacterium vanbaalenii]|nr:helix-turn-helix transcriptional regulator [Mycolicibacterium vanbaalenii]